MYTTTAQHHVQYDAFLIMCYVKVELLMLNYCTISLPLASYYIHIMCNITCIIMYMYLHLICHTSTFPTFSIPISVPSFTVYPIHVMVSTLFPSAVTAVHFLSDSDSLSDCQVHAHSNKPIKNLVTQTASRRNTFSRRHLDKNMRL